MDDHPFTNRLIKEKSPYLLQHAHNPVDWHPWGQEAFDLAKSEDKPIFLSIGYATCHWCHVMEKESFQDPEVAKLLNTTFICIKVDREEMPNIDRLYMDFAQVMMKSPGGWPLNVVLTPSLKPFFACTYLPAAPIHGLASLKQVVTQISSIWNSESKQQIIAQADEIVSAFEKIQKVEGEELPSIEEIEQAANAFFDILDPVEGGLKGAPKFPIGYHISYLLELAKMQQDSRAGFSAHLTLKKLSQGGIYDHIGGGFSRYSVDEMWRIPHFEKMLYDNALLLKAFVQGWLLNKAQIYKQIAEEIIAYCEREMLDPMGGFYSAQDADSGGEEGAFYTWSFDELEKVLQEHTKLFSEYFHFSKEGNFESRNVLFCLSDSKEFAEAHRLQEEDFLKLLQIAKEKLFEVREKREKPLIDDKILVSWNALMIDAFTTAARAFDNEKYLEIADRALKFILNHLVVDGKLMRRYREGEAKYQAGLEEYVYLIQALLNLFEAGKGVEYLKWAFKFNDLLNQQFKSSDGAYYQTCDEDTVLIRKCDFLDNSEPSANAVQCENLIRIYQMTFNPTYLLQAEDILKAARDDIMQSPQACVYMIKAFYRYHNKQSQTLVIVLNNCNENSRVIAKKINNFYAPYLTLVWVKPQEPEIFEVIPELKDKQIIDDKPTFYLCGKDYCRDPVVGIDKLETLMQNI